jgi:SAM-dependent methyltransferase
VAGFDCFLSANKVGENGKVIGIDMTPEMIKEAKENAKKYNYKNVEFKLGEISDLFLLKELPKRIKDSVEAYIGCLSGVMIKNEYLKIIKDAGFKNIKIIDETNYPVELMTNDLSITIYGTK